ncbi:MAG: HlyD family efflux transporter periplasmic adaptor subunit [Candidatus Hydrogenedens sp.]|nr:HlyD family efflux transporter periplasmic adaptor subunit [Candidatus Hydrogenedens sp.]
MRFSRTGCWLLVSGALALGSCAAPSSDLAVTGQIEGHAIAVGSRVGGRVAEVLVDEGAKVHPGDVLLRLEPDDAEAELSAARANLAAMEAQLAKLEAGAREEEIRAANAAAGAAKAEYDMALAGARSQEIDAARAKADALQADYHDAREDYDRAQGLYESSVAPASTRDHAQHRLEAAAQQLDAAREQLDLLVEGTRNEQIAMAKAGYERAEANADLLRNGARQEDIDAARASRDGAAAQVARAEVALREMTVTAPPECTECIVETLDLQPGDLVQPGAVARVTDPEYLEIRVYVGAVWLGKLSMGDSVRFTTDAHGAEAFEGRIEFIATEGEFTPRNLQTEEERVQQVFLVKIDMDSASGKLRPGMAATVHFGAP